MKSVSRPGYYKQFAAKFPVVKLERSARYVQADDVTYTAGGLSSGIDLTLRVVAEYFGAPVAQRTSDYMQYQGTDWK